MKIFLILIMILSVACTKELIPNSASDFEYKIENDGVILTGYKGTRTDMVIPREIEGLPVIEIGESSFDSCHVTGKYTNINSVVIPNTVKVIGDSAFSSTSLTKVVIPKSVEVIGNWAFAVTGLTNIR